MKKIYAISTLAGTIIGVGFFALPYITLIVGLKTILIYFGILGLVSFLIHSFFGELSLITPDYKRLPGFAKIYLGKLGERIVYFTSIISLFGAILAYLIVGGEFLGELMSSFFEKNVKLWTIFYSLIGSILIFFDVKVVEKIEFWGLILFLFVLFFVFFESFQLINPQNLLLPNYNSNWFLPYGPILFSLWGTALIPEIEEILRDKKEWLLRIIGISILISILIYLFFIFLVLGISGQNTKESALLSLREILGQKRGNLLLFFGVLTTFTSYLTLGLTLKKILWYDLKVTKLGAWFFTFFFPLFLFLVGIKKFIPLISFLGGVLLGFEGILILLMYQRAFSKKINFIKKILILSLIFFLSLGIFYEIFHFFRPWKF